MLYPCNRCGRMNTTAPSMCCDRCIREIDVESERYARETMRESEEILKQWRHEDKALARKGGCAVLAFATVALPVLLLVLDAVRLL
ncbi:hypothetical protein SacxiDRAFT_0457 [Saccharomonospora xinjiangensis XJ-54]|uniref:Uncharacterized protein n=1 Tax=Saccharomonospora xinjiangensis XJ-54 TaxID=882086 RepID=I0UXY0_9PSEU|nr:hypothetical protein SacxiDRAFT_0457 [Saccharomonospora xinjiangensis XJ-54]